MSLRFLKSRISDVLALLYPEYCPGCDDALQSSERVICTRCRFKLPRTKFIPKSGNQIEKLFWGKVNLEAATAFLQFHKGAEVMNLLHELKYKGNQDVGEVLGRMFVSEYKKHDFFETIEAIVPVPLHVTKERKRGYNQCDSICYGISDLTDIHTIRGALKRTRANATQTSKGRFERFTNTKQLFEVNDESIVGKHVLLVDDVVTTGSTLEACIHPLLAKNCKVSVACMAAPID
ncbi:MAG: ComF family protein [Flavobacteriales bacterium]